MTSHRSLLGRFAQPTDWTMHYPMGWAGRVPGDGCYVRHAYAVENAELYPGLWHTGENWYTTNGEAAGAQVYAVADGEVVFAGFDYPGAVIVIRHADDLYSQYGHLDYEVKVQEGQQVAQGDVIATVRFWEGGLSHLHFELRTFLYKAEVNGETPRYNFHCGLNCAPGPGYWPMDAPDHPSAMGWRNPLHVITHGMGVPTDAQVMVPSESWSPLLLFPEPMGLNHTASVYLPGGTVLPLRDAWAGHDASTVTGADATSVWYQIQVLDTSEPLWCPAISPTMHAIQQDGQTASFVFNLIPHR